MLEVLQISTGYTDGAIEKKMITDAGGRHVLISSEDEMDIINAGKDAECLLVALTVISAHVIHALPKLKLIVRAGIGVDNIDLAAAKDRGVHVCNLPTYCQDEVADHTVAMLLALERQLFQQVLDVRNGLWNPASTYKPIRGLSNSTLGLVGCGGIAQKVVQRLIPFGVKFLGYDPYLPQEVAEKLHIQLTGLDNLISNSDYISLHLPLNEQTKHILGETEFRKMKENACVINSARGPLIDTAALYIAIKEGVIRGAALDVIEGDLEATDQFANYQNVLVTPHTAYFSEQSAYNIRKQAGEIIADYILGKGLRNIIV